MASELSMTDDHGRKIHFGGDRETGTVTVNLRDRMTAVLVSLSLAKQDEFARLYVEACRRAEDAPAPVRPPSGAERVESAAHRLLGLPEGF